MEQNDKRLRHGQGGPAWPEKPIRACIVARQPGVKRRRWRSQPKRANGCASYSPYGTKGAAGVERLQ